MWGSETTHQDVVDAMETVERLFDYLPDMHPAHDALGRAFHALREASEKFERDFTVTFYVVVQREVVIRAASEDDALEKFANGEYNSYEADTVDDEYDTEPIGYEPEAEEA